MVLKLNKKYNKILLIIALILVIGVYLYDMYDIKQYINEQEQCEEFCDKSNDCKPTDYFPDEPISHKQYGTYDTCYQRKQIYLLSCDPDEQFGHADVILEKRFGKLYININANLPYAKGGVFHTMWGAYDAFLVDTQNKKSINLGSLVRHGDRFYKLSTDLAGDYSNYNEIRVYRNYEDCAPKLKLKGAIIKQQCL